MLPGLLPDTYDIQGVSAMLRALNLALRLSNLHRILSI
jgi:hypothetical protein